MKTPHSFPHERLLRPIEETTLEWKGENTPFQSRHDDVYFTLDSGFEETEAIFIGGNDLPGRFERWTEKTKPFVVGELGFGTGLNFLLAAEEFIKRNASGRFYFISTEKYPIRREDHREFFRRAGFFDRFPLARSLLDQMPGAVPGFHLLSFLESRVQLLLLIGDANETLDQLEAKVDAWFLDGFTPAKNPDLWSDSVFKSLARLSHAESTASSYTSAGWVRRGLESVGFAVAKRPGFGKKRESIVANYRGPVEPMFMRTRPWFRSRPPEPRTVYEIQGAGIAGLEIANRLVRGGADVRIHDPAFEFAASKNPLALVMPQFARAYTPLHHLTAQAFEKWNRVRKTHSRIPGLTGTGVLRLKKNDESFEDLDRAMSWMPLDRDSWRWLSEVETSQRTSGKFSERSLCIESAFTLAFPEYLEDLSSSMGSRLERSAQPFAHPSVIADGTQAHPHPLLDGNLNPMRGQIAIAPVGGTVGSFALSRDGYLISDQSAGKMLLGGTYERGQREPILDASRRAELWDHWPEFHPELPPFDDASVNGWMGFRTVSRDHLPVCGPLADPEFFRAHYSELWRGRREDEYPDAEYSSFAYTALGLGSKGALFSKLIGDTLGGLLLGEPLSIEWSQWLRMSPARFWVRKHSTRNE